MLYKSLLDFIFLLVLPLRFWKYKSCNSTTTHQPWGGTKCKKWHRQDDKHSLLVIKFFYKHFYPIGDLRFSKTKNETTDVEISTKCTLAAICQKQIHSILYEGTDCNFKGKLTSQEEKKKLNRKSTKYSILKKNIYKCTQVFIYI